MSDTKKDQKHKFKYLHNVKNVDFVNGEKTIYEENIYEREDGVIVIKYSLKTKGDWEKISIAGKDDEYKLRILNSKGKKDESTISKTELTKFIGKDESLKFAKKFLGRK